MDNIFSEGRISALPGSPFVRLRALLQNTHPAKDEISLALGEPKHAPPQFVLDALKNTHDYDRYPPIQGIPELRAAIEAWLVRRFHLESAMFAQDTQILPLNGTREGLFLATQLGPTKPNGAILMPNPFYQVYAAAAIAAHAEPVYLPTTEQTGFLPDLDAIAPELLDRCQSFFICSPANPQGAVASRAYLTKLVELARRHKFLLLVDECYSEIYDRSEENAPPPSVLEVLSPDTIKDAPVIAFHSLSKRSNLPGLRSGFCVGGEQAMAQFANIRQVAGPQSPIPAQRAAALAWADDQHVVENRALYHQKFDLAEKILGNEHGFFRPAGGFFLWLNVGDGEAATLSLWRDEGIRVLPGAYLTQNTTNTSSQIGDAFIRVALVSPFEQTQIALERLKSGLDNFANQKAQS